VEGIVHSELITRGQVVNSAFYKEVLREAIQEDWRNGTTAGCSITTNDRLKKATGN
jgi:hypothetical protein